MTPPPSGAHLPPPVAAGDVCAWCMREFVQPHGHPVYCERCYDKALTTRKSFGLLPKAEYRLKNPE